MKKAAVLILSFLITGICVKAQVKLKSGSVSTLDNVKAVNIVYDYSNMKVGEYDKEEDYVKKHSAELEEKKKGSSETFKKDWVDARKRRYEPKFEELFKKHGIDKLGMDGTNYSTANDVTLYVHTVYMDLGFNVGVMKKPSYINVECTFKDKSGKELCTFYVEDARGTNPSGFDFAVEARMLESYANAAKLLVNGIKKERKKAK